MISYTFLCTVFFIISKSDRLKIDLKTKTNNEFLLPTVTPMIREPNFKLFFCAIAVNQKLSTHHTAELGDMFAPHRKCDPGIYSKKSCKVEEQQ